MKVAETLVRGEVRWCVDLGKVDGRRKRKFFKTKEEAEKFATKAKGEKKWLGDWAFTLSLEERMSYIAARDRLASVGATVSEAVEFFLNRKPATESKPLAKAVAE